jgi:hypothetical protein
LNLLLKESAVFLGGSPEEVLRYGRNVEKAKQLGQALFDPSYQRGESRFECPNCFSNMDIDPGLMFGFGASLEPVLRTIIGGAGIVWGPVIGSVVLEVLSEVTRSLSGEINGLHLAIYGLVLILSCIYILQGLATVIANLLESLFFKKIEPA